MMLSQEQVDYCMECGVCTGSCPVSRVVPTFSPRQMIKRTLMEKPEEVARSREVWACLTCGRCSTRCPVQIDIPEFARGHRVTARNDGHAPQVTHHGVLQTITGMQTNANIKQNRTGWAEETGKFVSTGDYFYFVGCSPYFDAALKFGAPSLEASKSVLKLLNRMGIEPVISNDECCCGHDALWSGDEATFKKLAARNLEVIRGSGARTVIFNCPEGYVTFKDSYRKHFGDLPFEVIHMSEFLARELPAANVSFKPVSNGSSVVTYQDPCRLGRYAGIYDAPRELLKMVPEVKFAEMERSRENALCCGTSAWIECSSCSKAMQIERLNEALRTGARTLVTACPKCQIHLACAMSGTEIDVNIVDLYAFVLDAMS